jgi:hypothetical protein
MPYALVGVVTNNLHDVNRYDVGDNTNIGVHTNIGVRRDNTNIGVTLNLFYKYYGALHLYDL